jgi:hypothetical protein
VYVQLQGPIDDQAHLAWRSAADENFVADGLPLFLCIDGAQATSAATLAGRLKVASWVRGLQGRLAGGAVFLGGQQQLLFIARSILRVVALDAIRVLNDGDALEALLNEWRAAPADLVSARRALLRSHGDRR